MEQHTPDWVPKNKREAREWVRQHWVIFIGGADLPDPTPALVDDVWDDECAKIVRRLGY